MRSYSSIAVATVLGAAFAFMSIACVVEIVKAEDQQVNNKVAPDELYVMLFRGVPFGESAIPNRDHVLTLLVQEEKAFSVWVGDGYPKLDGIITVKDTAMHVKITANLNTTAGTFVGPVEKDTPIKPSQSGFGSGIQPFFFIITSDPQSNMKKK